jgi:hypothetical protein
VSAEVSSVKLKNSQVTKVVKMPRNTTGGTGHKARANGEGSTAKKNRTLVEAFIDDIAKEDECDGVHVARILRRLGDGRMEALYIDPSTGAGKTVIGLIKGSLRGRGARQAPIGVNSLVLMQETGLSGAAYEIIGVFDSVHLGQLKKVRELDARLTATEITDSETLKNKVVDETGFEWDYGAGAAAGGDEDIDVDGI